MKRMDPAPSRAAKSLIIQGICQDRAKVAISYRERVCGEANVQLVVARALNRTAPNNLRRALLAFAQPLRRWNARQVARFRGVQFRRCGTDIRPESCRFGELFAPSDAPSLDEKVRTAARIQPNGWSERGLAPAVDRDVPARLSFLDNQELDGLAAAARASETNAPIFPIVLRKNQVSTR